MDYYRKLKIHMVRVRYSKSRTPNWITVTNSEWVRPKGFSYSFMVQNVCPRPICWKLVRLPRVVLRRNRVFKRWGWVPSLLITEICPSKRQPDFGSFLCLSHFRLLSEGFLCHAVPPLYAPSPWNQKQ